MTEPTTGAPAPPFQSRDQFGKPVSLAGLRGRPTLLVFFPFAFTSLCTGELRDLRDHLATITNGGCRVVAVSTDTMFALRTLDEAENLGFPLLSDHWPHGAIARDYGVFDEGLGCAQRVTFLMDADGIVRWRHSSDLPEPREIGATLAAIDNLTGS